MPNTMSESERLAYLQGALYQTDRALQLTDNNRQQHFLRAALWLLWRVAGDISNVAMDSLGEYMHLDRLEPNKE